MSTEYSKHCTKSGGVIVKFKRQFGFIIFMLVTFLVAAFYQKSEVVITSAPAETAIQESIKLPILMYHLISEKPKKWGKYVVSPAELEHDIQMILKQGFTPVFVNDLIAYKQGKGTLPDKPIMITFDDGNRSDYVYAFELAKKYKIKMISSTVGAYTERYSSIADKNIDYAHLSWDEMHEMQNSGFFEFQNHSYNLHNCDINRKGCLKKRGESDWHYENLIGEDFKLSQQLFKKNELPVPKCFTYPYGGTNDTLLNYVKKNGFLASLGTYERVNVLNGSPDELYNLCRYNRTHNMDITKILRQVE